MEGLGLTAVLAADITSFEGAMLAALNIAKNFATSFKNEISASIDSVSKSFKESGNFDITIGNFQKLQFAAEQTGTSFQTLQMAALRMEKNIGDATFGRPQAMDSFKKLGIDVQALAKLPLDEQFLKVAKAFDKVGNTAQAATLSMRLFGIAGVREMQFLKELSANSEKFKRLLVPTTDEGGDAIYQAKQALTEIDAIWANIYNQIAEKIAPILRNVVTMLEDAGFNGLYFKTILDSAGESLYNFSVRALSVGYELRDMWGGILEKIQTSIRGIEIMANKLAIVVNMIGVLPGMKNVMQGAFGGAVGALGPGAFGGAGAADMAGKDAAGIIENSKRYTDKAKDFIDSLLKVTPIERPVRSGEMIPPTVKTNPLGYAINATNTRASIGALQMAQEKVQIVSDPQLLQAVKEGFATQNGGPRLY